MENNKPVDGLAKVLQERGREYGEYKDVAATAQRLKRIMKQGGTTLPDAHQESVDMICSKLARLACGDFNKIDTWQDIAGYATLIVRHLVAEGE